MMNLFYALLMSVFAFSLGTVYNSNSKSVPESASCQVCPKLPDNYFTIETVETQHCVTAVGDTVISKVIKESRVEIE